MTLILTLTGKTAEEIVEELDEVVNTIKEGVERYSDDANEIGCTENNNCYDYCILDEYYTGIGDFITQQCKFQKKFGIGG